MKIKPFIIDMPDYHLFKYIKDGLKSAGFYQIKYIDCGFWDDNYHAVFYTDKKSAQKLIREQQEFYEKYWS